MAESNVPNLSIKREGKEVSDDEEMVQVKMLMALVDDKLVVGKNHARNGEWIDITMRKEQLKEEKHVNEKCISSSDKYASSSKQIMTHKEKPFTPCTHCGFNDHHPDEYCISTIHLTIDHRDFDHFKRGKKLQAAKAKEPTKGDYEEDYQRELQGDAQEDKLTTTIMLLARAITRKFFTPTNNRLHTSSNTRNQAVIHDGRVDIQTKNAWYGGNGNRNARRQNKNQTADAKMVRFRRLMKMLLAMKDEVGGTLNDEENDFMLAYGDEILEELTAAVILMVIALQIDLISGMISKSVHQHTNHEKLKTIINTSDYDQIDSNIIFDVPYAKNNGRTDEHDSNAHVKSFDIKSLSKENKSKKKVLKNNNVKSTSTNVWKLLCSISIVSNMRESRNSIVCQPNANVLKVKTINVVNDASNIVCVSYGKDVFMLSHEKYIARYALSVDSRVKRALFTSSVAAKSRNIGATFVVAKSRFGVAKTPIATNKVIQLVFWIVDSGYSKHMTGNLQLLRNFVEKLIGIVCFGNDHFAAITGYGDYVQGNLTICHVYYVEGLRHNLFLGKDLLTGSRVSNLYTISISELPASSPVCLMSKATSTKSWLWHRRLSHLNFDCEQGKSKKASFPPKLVPSTESKLDLPHMDLEPIANEPITSVSNKNANEPVLEGVAAFDENNFYNLFHSPMLEEVESSSTFQDPSNMHEFYQKHCSTDLQTKNHPIEQVIGNPSKPLMTRRRLHISAEM
uniref:Uncharacterized protein n=1 Tax=Tanacetum cinerariifolium TaxID=118510 RepID=A0A6L2LT81_TANCI|nr:hypothetical protein [Tanacetum cinerariifolium]